jgi:ProP effector
VEAVIEELVGAFPAAFTRDPTLVRPLKLGIRNDICARSSMSRSRIMAALRAYCNSERYLAVCKEGALRVDLTGAPAGVVTATEAEHGRAARAQPSVKRAGKTTSAPRAAREPKETMKRKPSPAPAGASRQTVIGEEGKTPAAISGPKRSSLADLRKAALARRAGR